MAIRSVKGAQTDRRLFCDAVVKFAVVRNGKPLIVQGLALRDVLASQRSQEDPAGVEGLCFDYVCYYFVVWGGQFRGVRVGPRI